MAFTTVPTPLWTLYRERDGFSAFVVTVVFAAYAVGVAVSLFLVGHLSDRHGRRRVLVPAVLANAAAAVIFLVWPDLPGLVLARALSGLGVGAVTATATAWIAELHTAHRPGASPRRAQLVATSANLGGFGVGALASGLLAQGSPAPLSVPYAVFLGLLLVAAGLALATPETHAAPVPRPPYRPQRVAVPPARAAGSSRPPPRRSCRSRRSASSPRSRRASSPARCTSPRSCSPARCRSWSSARPSPPRP
ncbi:hypothetical protein BJF78_21235 [Pseudonocardia sp. CNS-139]|nr:hypothetical protein BJF78_21235 [Pseudonocardia sp. CNS-139]